MIIKFGKHTGEHIEDLPISYLAWLHRYFDLPCSMKDEVEYALKEFGYGYTYIVEKAQLLP